jgi:hypothetical protein
MNVLVFNTGSASLKFEVITSTSSRYRPGGTAPLQTLGDYSRGIGEGHSSRIRFYESPTSLPNGSTVRDVGSDPGPTKASARRLSSGFETKDRRVQCPSRTHGIEIFS